MFSPSPKASLNLASGFATTLTFEEETEEAAYKAARDMGVTDEVMRMFGLEPPARMQLASTAGPTSEAQEDEDEDDNPDLVGMGTSLACIMSSVHDAGQG